MSIENEINSLIDATSELFNAVNVTKSAIDTAIEDASSVATATALAAAQTAQAASSASGSYPNSASTVVPRGVTGSTGLVAGSGGADGTFALAFTGGGSSATATGTFTVAGGVVTSINITGPGYGYTSAPTVSFAASTGLTGASATIVIGSLVASGEFYWAASLDNTMLSLYQNAAGSAIAVTPAVSIPATPMVNKLSDLAIRANEATFAFGRPPLFANLFDINRVTSDFAINTNGSPFGSTGNTMSEFIPVLPTKSYVFSRKPAQVSFYDSAGVYLAGSYAAFSGSIFLSGSISGATFTPSSAITLAVGTPIHAPNSPGGVEILSMESTTSYTLNKTFAIAVANGPNSISVGQKVTAPANAAYIRFSQPTVNSGLAGQALYAGTELPAEYGSANFLNPMATRRQAMDRALEVSRRIMSTDYSILDTSKTNDGQALGITGSLYTFSGYFVTPYMQAIPGDQFIANFASGPNGACWYDENLTPLYPFSITAGTAFTAPANARFWRSQSGLLATKGNCRAYFGTVIPTNSPGFPVPAADATVGATRIAVTQARVALDSSNGNPRQLFNRDDSAIFADRAISNNNAVYTATNYGVTGFIEVTGDVPHISNTNSVAGQVCYYDENFAFINSGTNYSISPGVPFVPPTGAYWMRRSIANFTIVKTDMYVYRASYATARIIFSANAAVNDTVSINGVVITFVASGATGNQVNIGGGYTTTVTNLNTFINANSVALACTSVVVPGGSSNTIQMTSNSVGPVGNTIALSRVSTNFSVSSDMFRGATPVSLGFKSFGSSGGSAGPASGIAIGFFGNSQTANNFYQTHVTGITGGSRAFSFGHPGRSFASLADTDFATDFPDAAALNSAKIVWVTEGHNEWAAPGARVLGTVEDDATQNTMCGKLRKILDQFLALDPTIIVGFTGCPYRGYFSYDAGGGNIITGNPDTTKNTIGGQPGYTGAEMDDMIRLFCKRWALPFADLRGGCGISALTDVNNASNNGKKTWTSDGLHWTAATSKRIGHIIADATNRNM